MEIKAYVDANTKTIEFESNGVKTKVSFDEWDEHGSCKIDGLLMDYHILFDEEFSLDTYTLHYPQDGVKLTREMCAGDYCVSGLQPDEYVPVTLTNETIKLEDTFELIEVVYRYYVPHDYLIAVKCGEWLKKDNFLGFDIAEGASFQIDYNTYLKYTRPLTNKQRDSEELEDLKKYILEEEEYRIIERKRLGRK